MGIFKYSGRIHLENIFVCLFMLVKQPAYYYLICNVTFVYTLDILHFHIKCEKIVFAGSRIVVILNSYGLSTSATILVE
jgi:hypothetical protein